MISTENEKFTFTSETVEIKDNKHNPTIKSTEF